MCDVSKLTITALQKLLCEMRGGEAIHTCNQDPRSLGNCCFLLSHIFRLYLLKLLYLEKKKEVLSLMTLLCSSVGILRSYLNEPSSSEPDENKEYP